MRTIDYRNTTWQQLQGSLHGRLLEVLRAWKQHGAMTTRQLAEQSGIDLLNVRPRTTDLVQLGLVRALDVPGSEGVYEALSDEEAMRLFAVEQAKARNEDQLGLQL